MFREIGGYLELETYGAAMYHSNAILLNSGRNALRYVIRANGINELYLPYYTCPVVWEAVSEENCRLHYYEIGKDFLPSETLPQDAYILCNDYFGICSNNVSQLSQKYENLIVDNAQSFYAKPKGIASIYSPRKFFGLPDGGLLICDKNHSEQFERGTSHDRMTHLLKRHDLSANTGYEEFKVNDGALSGLPIMQMSHLTNALMSNIDYERVRQKRLENFHYLHNELHNINELDFDANGYACPMVYPLLIKNDGLREKLIAERIYIARYWEGVGNVAPNGSYALYLSEYLLPLPLDQRYGADDMRRISRVVKEFAGV